jgi:hypothetical protein
MNPNMVVTINHAVSPVIIFSVPLAVVLSVAWSQGRFRGMDAVKLARAVKASADAMRNIFWDGVVRSFSPAAIPLFILNTGLTAD